MSMTDGDREYWTTHAAALKKFAIALHRVLNALAPDSDDRRTLHDALAIEPVPEDLVPSVDAERVDLGMLLERLDAFWAAYRALPSPPGSNSWTKYLRLPEPYPRMQRGMLDQCFRVVHSRRGTVEPSVQARLESSICGDAGQPPGMENYVQRYHQLLFKDPGTPGA
jgi:hypothetical protein